MDIKNILLPYFEAFVTDKETGINSESQQLAEKLHKPIIRNFIKCEVYSSFKNIIWNLTLVDTQLIKNYNK